MKRPLLAGTVVVAALGLAACGGTAGGASNSGSSTAKPATVSVRQVSGVGSVLVDASGRALYTPAQEAHGKILCSGACVAIWRPAPAGGHNPTASGNAGKLAVVRRANGVRQVTVNGMPAYTFVQDNPGKVTGNGAKDAFGGRKFTWHVLLASGKVGATSNKPTSSSGGYGGSSGGGYNSGY